MFLELEMGVNLFLLLFLRKLDLLLLFNDCVLLAKLSDFDTRIEQVLKLLSYFRHVAAEGLIWILLFEYLFTLLPVHVILIPIMNN